MSGEQGLSLETKNSGEVSGQRLEALGFIAGQLAHDMNNKLTVVLGNLSLLSYMLEDAVDDPDVGGALQDTLTAAQQMRLLNRRLQSMTSAFAPKQELCDGCERIQAIVAAWRQAADECPVAFPPREVILKVDKEQLRTALVELLNNARKAGTKVWVDVKNILVQAEDDLYVDQGPALDIQVWDNGPGVDSSIRTEIFEPYYTTDKKASGVGLTIARSIARRHHGELLCEDVEKGACFRLILPASKGDF